MNSKTKLNDLKSELKIDAERLSYSLENFIKEYVEKLEREGIILGLSGGIDSAVLASLCKRAVGEKNVLALIMPEKDSKKENIQDAVDFANKLNIKSKLIDITPYLKKLKIYKLFLLNRLPFIGKSKSSIVKKAYNFYEQKTGKTPFSSSIKGFKDKKYSSYLKKNNAYYRIKHRMRMILLYLNAELENRLVVGAANKTEYKTGFFVKHGCDDDADIMPLLNLYKTQIRQLAHYLNITTKIIQKQPSPDILPGITDEQALGISYEKLDLILLAVEKGWEIEEISKTIEISKNKIIQVIDLNKQSEHMRKTYVSDLF